MFTMMTNSFGFLKKPSLHSYVASVQDLSRKSLVRSPPRPIFFRGLMVVIATGFILLSALSIFSKRIMWTSRQWLRKNIVRGIGKKNSAKT